MKDVWEISLLSLQLFRKSKITPKQNIDLKIQAKEKTIQESKIVPNSAGAVQITVLLRTPLYSP